MSKDDHERSRFYITFGFCSLVVFVLPKHVVLCYLLQLSQFNCVCVDVKVILYIIRFVYVSMFILVAVVVVHVLQVILLFQNTSQ